MTSFTLRFFLVQHLNANSIYNSSLKCTSLLSDYNSKLHSIFFLVANFRLRTLLPSSTKWILSKKKTLGKLMYNALHYLLINVIPRLQQKVLSNAMTHVNPVIKKKNLCIRSIFAFSLLMIGKKMLVIILVFQNLHLRIDMRRERERKTHLSKTPATFFSRLESLNISEKGLICSLLNLSPLRKSMALSIRLLISSGPEWTCKACARWFGSRFIEFLVRAARV